MSARITEAMVEALQAAHNLIANTAFDAGESHDWAVAVDEKIQAALRLSTEPGEAEVLVPREPTEEMLISGCAIPGVSLETGRRMYRAMLAAAPLREDTHHGR